MTELLPTSLLHDVRNLIDSARARAAETVNAELTLLYWQIGRRIRDDCCVARGPSTADRSSPSWRGS
jgi:hypothetical protein